MANRSELKKLQEDLGPYYNQPLAGRRQNHTPAGSPTLGPKRSNTPDSTSASKRHAPSSRDSTPNQPPARPRSKGKSNHRHSLSRDSSTPKRSPRPDSVPPTSTPPLNPARSSSFQMSQRNRSGRGSNRNNGNSHGEEAQIWEQVKSQVQDIVGSINAENDNLTQLVEMDKKAGAMNPDNIPGSSMQQMEQLCRSGVKHSEGNMANIKAVIDQLKILRAVVVAKEQSEAAAAGPSKRTARDSAAAASSLYDFDGAGDSPVPSPIGAGSSRKFGDRSSQRDRDSVPPKADSVEPQGPSGSGGPGASAAANARSKVVFQKGDSVAFKPRLNNDQTSDWILGEVLQVSGEGKSRRYKVLDIEPDDQSKQREYRTSASSMIPITPESQASTLKDWQRGQIVLALYPQTTTFYKAEVDSMAGGKVNLKFEGENDSTTTQQVERRFVIEYRP